MSATILYGDEARQVSDAREDGEHLWLSPADLEAATGWALKPEGLCRDEACVVLPQDRSWLDAGGRVDLAAFARHLGRPVVRDEENSIWAFGESAAARRGDDSSVEAPDFTLPDLDGAMHSLSDYRGRKVFLASWASW